MPTRLEAEITRRVIDAREGAGLSRAEVAEALSLDPNSYGHYERGRYAFTVDQIWLISRLLGHSPEHFLGLNTALTSEEDELLNRFRQQDVRGKEAILAVVRNLPPPETGR